MFYKLNRTPSHTKEANNEKKRTEPTQSKPPTT